MKPQTHRYAGEMTRIEFEQEIRTARAVLVPVGSCEQHGYHLPLDTDNIIGTYLAEKAAEETGCIVMPPVNYGQVWSARKLPGSISLKTDTLKAILKDIILSLSSFSAKNILIVAGHNGNAGAIRELARELLADYEIRNLWYWCPSAGKELAGLLESPIPCGCVHAGEMETSMLMAIRPELVHLDRAEAEFPSMPERAKYQPVSWDEYLTVGSFGDPGFATKEKGEKFLEASVGELVHLIRDVMQETAT